MAVLFGGGDGITIFNDVFLLQRAANGSFSWKYVPFYDEDVFIFC